MNPALQAFAPISLDGEPVAGQQIRGFEPALAVPDQVAVVVQPEAAFDPERFGP